MQAQYKLKNANNGTKKGTVLPVSGAVLKNGGVLFKQRESRNSSSSQDLSLVRKTQWTTVVLLKQNFSILIVMQMIYSFPFLNHQIDCLTTIDFEQPSSIKFFS